MIINYKLIGQRIRKCRIEKSMTQENIAEHLDISVSYVSRVERAAVKISLETLVRIAMFLNVSPSYLIDGTIAVTKDYLHSELAEIVGDFSPEKMSLLLGIAKEINQYK